MNNFRPFGSYTFRWWQLGLYETACLALGLGLGSLYSETFRPLVPVLLLVFVFIAPYIFFLYLSQVRSDKSDGGISENDLPGKDRGGKEDD